MRELAAGNLIRTTESALGGPATRAAGIPIWAII